MATATLTHVGELGRVIELLHVAVDNRSIVGGEGGLVRLLHQTNRLGYQIHAVADIVDQTWRHGAD
jgi:hypothetical protein